MGSVIASLIIVLWAGHLIYSFVSVPADAASPAMYIHMLIQAYLYTGLFITAHDAMHGTVSRRKRINRLIGIVSLLLFAGMNYNKIIKSHHLHHKYPGSEKDPDFNVSSQNFVLWWLRFMMGYITVIQLLIMAAAFNILNYWFSQNVLFAYWIIPAFLSTLQLFYFGTYLPHRYPHNDGMKPHNSRTQGKNHLWAMVSCYFFGYHNEHHESPGTPWWQLYRIKE